MQMVVNTKWVHLYMEHMEIEDWCEKNDMWVDKYLDHVNP